MGATINEDKLTILYLFAVGALMYLGLTTCSDISNAIGILSHFSANPGPAHQNPHIHIPLFLQNILIPLFLPQNSNELCTILCVDINYSLKM